MIGYNPHSRPLLVLHYSHPRLCSRICAELLLLLPLYAWIADFLSDVSVLISREMDVHNDIVPVLCLIVCEHLGRAPYPINLIILRSDLHPMEGDPFFSFVQEEQNLIVFL